MDNVTEAKRCIRALGDYWRADWSEFDGRSLRSQLNSIVDVIDAPDYETAKRLADDFVEEHEVEL